MSGMRRLGERELRLPAGLRGEMRSVVGEIAAGARLLLLAKSSRTVVSVGDVCTANLLRAGIVPKLSIIDAITKRGKAEGIDFPREVRKVHVSNPPETITPALWRAIEGALGAPGSTAIIVDGEEDLASLACIHLAPEGTTVIYGVPNRGAMVITVEGALKARVARVLERMED
ncbi:MAG: GTP-dependent dephospho-CoA kinase family protein [Euryarchaeota archaeon]|nr:GTP-dependent dephospho-CoA kinase family protein [Euryarchaeota archaeon]